VSSALAQTPSNQSGPEGEVDRRYIEPNAWPPSPGDRYYEAYREGQAQLGQPQEQTMQDQRGERFSALEPQQFCRCLRVSELIRADARGRDGEDLGHIEDVTLDMDNLRVLYVVLAHGGVLGLGTEHFAVQSSDVNLETTRRYKLAVAKADLDERDAFTGAEADWPRQADSYLLGSPQQGMSPRSATVENWHKASKLIGVDLENRQGETLGEIEDIVIDAERERVAYIIASREDDGTRMVTIPAAAVTIEPDRDALLDMPVNQFNQCATFTKDRAPDFDDLGWGRQVHGEFSVPVYWEVPTDSFGIEQ
jgi:sporulation protein YlmC with PRC-barrel domain